MSAIDRELAPCAFRDCVPQTVEFRCRLVGQLLGLESAERCRVDLSACRLCLREGDPTAARPSSVVSSLTYNLARQIRGDGGWPDCDGARAWQTECYVRPTLAGAEDETPGRVRGRWPFEQWFRRPERPARRRQPARIGLIGYDTASGLGYLNRDLADRGLVDSWMRIDHPRYPSAAAPTADERSLRFREGDDRMLRRWLNELEWVVWIESCPIKGLPDLARRAGVRSACIPMWEWISPADSWLKQVDLLICPTAHAAALFQGWRRRFAMPWRVAAFPWPIAVDQFRFRQRQVCRRLVYVHGRGGSTARSLDRNHSLGQRKGLDLILNAASLTPDIPWTIHSQVPLMKGLPANVVVRGAATHRADLYEEGDLCVQPSRWEGLGLPLLECQAAGLPLVTFDLPPMNECRPLRRIPIERCEWGYLVEGQPIAIPVPTADSLVAVIRDLQGRDLQQASQEAHDWVRNERSWDVAAGRWRQLFDEVDRAEAAP